MRIRQLLALAALSSITSTYPVLNSTTHAPTSYQGLSAEQALKAHIDLMKREPPPGPTITQNGQTYQACSPQQIATLQTTFQHVHDLTTLMSTSFTQGNPYVQAFWQPDAMGEEWMHYGREYFYHMGLKVSQGKVRWRCDPACPAPGVVAYTVAERNEISFCNQFFSQFDFATNLKCEDGKGLGGYDARERALTHELTHTNLVPEGQDGKGVGWPWYNGPTQDIQLANGEGAYGVPKALGLARAKPSVAMKNADNWALIAWGTWLQATCAAKTGNKGFRMPIQ